MPITSLPNLLTLSRILAIPVVIATFYVPGDYARWFACALFSAAGVTDWLDGHMARRWEQQSEIGRFLDPIADKLLVFGDIVHADGHLDGSRPRRCCRHWSSCVERSWSPGFASTSPGCGSACRCPGSPNGRRSSRWSRSGC